MTLPTLYKRTSEGKIQSWSVSVNEGIAALDDSCDAYYFFISGIHGGKQVISKPTIVKVGKNIGKVNETGRHQQAELEAHAKWKKKLDEGYTEDIANVDSAKAALTIPMTAKTYGKHVKPEAVAFPVYSQPKFDGARMMVTRDGCFSKQGLDMPSGQFIRQALQPLFDHYPDLVAVDGELFNIEFISDFDSLMSLATKKKPSEADLALIREKLHFYIFDAEFKAPAPFDERWRFLQSVLDPSPHRLLYLSDTQLVHDQSELDAEYAKYLAIGHEGQMIRNPKGVYQRDKRTKDLIKRKEMIDEEFEVVGYELGIGNYEGTISFNCRLKNGAIRADGQDFFNAPINASLDTLRQMHDRRDEFIGQWWTVRYQNLTPEGVPRFPKAIRQREMTDGKPAY